MVTLLQGQTSQALPQSKGSAAFVHSKNVTNKPASFRFFFSCLQIITVGIGRCAIAHQLAAVSVADRAQFQLLKKLKLRDTNFHNVTYNVGYGETGPQKPATLNKTPQLRS